MKIWILNAAVSAPYAILRRLSDGYVWNGSDWEVWADGNIATYDVALTDQGGGLWTADVPSGVILGLGYAVEYREQAGASPAVSDQTLRSGALATDADLEKLIAAHYDSATVSTDANGDSVITLSNGATQTFDSDGRTLSE